MSIQEHQSNFNTLPVVTSDCIKAQSELIQRESPRRAALRFTKMMKRENPELIEFITETAEELYSEEFLPEPIAAHCKVILVAHCSLIYNMLRAQLEADQMNDAWINRDTPKLVEDTELPPTDDSEHSNE